MKIDSSSPAPRPNRSSPPPTPADAGPPQTVPTDGNADAIEISPEARRVIEFPRDARERADLVARLRREVDAGTYRPDPELIARRLTEQADQ